jgi:hypothetical protein
MTQIAAHEGVTQTLRPPADPAAPAMVDGIAEGTQVLEGTHALELTAQALLSRRLNCGSVGKLRRKNSARLSRAETKSPPREFALACPCEHLHGDPSRARAGTTRDRPDAPGVNTRILDLPFVRAFAARMRSRSLPHLVAGVNYWRFVAWRIRIRL